MTKDDTLPYGTSVRLSWYDSQYLDGWRYGDPDKLGGAACIESLGYVVTSKRDDGIVISTSIAAKGGVLNPVTIPWAAIQSIETLEKDATQ